MGNSHLEEQYPDWVASNRLGEADVLRLRERAAGFGNRPRIRILLPTQDPDVRRLRRVLDSVLSQVYQRWELRIRVCSRASKREILDLLGLYERLDERIRVEETEGATNSTSYHRDEEFAALLGQDDALAPDALFRVVELLQDHPDADLVHTDEDRVDSAGVRSNPHFKPGWSPDFLLSHDYLSRLCVYRRGLLEDAEEGWSGTLDTVGHDLTLRLTERTEKIYHVPRVLYHRCSDKPDTDRESSRTALAEALERRGIEGTVEDGLTGDGFRVIRQVSRSPKVSIIIPTRDNATLLENCVRSIERLTTYPNYEIVIVDNRNAEASAVEYLSSTPHHVVTFDADFNFSEINNLAASRTDGEHLLFLNDDTEVISGDWLQTMLGHAQREEVGAVGAKLLYPDGRIQHGGVLLGVGSAWAPGVATHSHQHYDQDSWGHGGSLVLERNYSAVTAACMMIRRQVFEEIGGFDGTLKISFNDVDLCMRLRERGYLVVYTPFAELHHHESVSRGHESDPAEVLLMRARWSRELDDDPYHNPNFSQGTGDYRLRADMLRPRILRPIPGETGRELPKHPREMEPDERRIYITAKQEQARSLRGTGLVDAKESLDSVPETQAPEDRPDVRPHGPREREKDVEPGVFFIVGQPKSGTSWVRSALDSHPQISCLGEGKFFGRDFKRDNPSSGGELPSLHGIFADSEELTTWARAVGPWISRSGNPETRERELKRHTRGLARAAIKYFLEEERVRSGKPIVGDKTPAHMVYLAEIHEFFPEARILHVLRDGRDQAVSSVFHWWKQSDKSYFAGLPPNVFRIKDAYFENRHSFGASGRSIFDEQTLRGLARGWRQNVSRARQEGPELFGEQYMELRYEDLLERPEKVFGEAFELLGAEHDQEMVARCVQQSSFEQMTNDRKRGVEDSGSFFRKGIAGDWKNYFTTHDRLVFEEEAGDLLDLLGYERG